MQRFMIGQYGGFDYKKYHRDFREGFYGIEACLFDHEEDILKLIKESKDKGFHIGIHFPLRAGNARLRDALFLSQDHRIREEAYTYIQQELEYLSSVKPSYVLFHYPKPVILDNRVNWHRWRFTDDSEYVYESNYSYDEFKKNSETLFQWLSNKGRDYDFTPVLELDVMNRYIYETNLLEDQLNRYDNVKVCLDTGRLFLQARIDPYFDAREILVRYTKYAEIIHLSNVQVNEKIDQSHFPVLPELSEEEGWAPIADYLHIIRRENSHVKVLFEHRSELISDEELDRCYFWVDRLLNSL